MARKTVRIDQLPADVREQLEQAQVVEDAEKRLRKLLTGNHRLLDAAVLVPAETALDIFTAALAGHRAQAIANEAGAPPDAA